MAKKPKPKPKPKQTNGETLSRLQQACKCATDRPEFQRFSMAIIEKDNVTEGAKKVEPVESVHGVSGAEESAIAAVVGVRERIARRGARHELVQVVDVAASPSSRRRVVHLNGHRRVALRLVVHVHLVELEQHGTRLFPGNHFDSINKSFLVGWLVWF